MRPPRPVRWLGDSAFHVEESGLEQAQALASAIRGQAWTGVEEVVVGHRTVTVVVDPAGAEIEELADWSASLAAGSRSELSPRAVEIPVAFDGADLEEVARHAGMTPAAVPEMMVGAELVVAMVGFVPGFGYLAGLPEPLASVPRRATPRARVEAGTVALGGGYAGVYPVATPGGWQVVGHTAMRLFDRDTPPFAVLGPGDRVRFREVEYIEHEPEPAPGRAVLTAHGGPASVRVVRPGTLSMIQDGGRVGFASLGVPKAGAADSLSARLANRAVGNLDGAAVIEMTVQGAELRLAETRCVALVGDADLSIDGRAVAPGAVHPVAPWQIIGVGRIGPRPRAFLAIAGGLEGPVVLGSRSSDLLCGLGPGALVAGDELALGPPGRARGRFLSPEGSTTLRVLRGPDVIDDDRWERLEAASYVVGVRSDRTGVRLEPDAPLPVVDAVPGSVAMVTGAVQLSPDGRLIILGVDHATLGGYPVVAAVVTADLSLLGQLRPGDVVRLEPVDRALAARLRRERESFLGRSLQGWYPVRAG